MSKPERAPSHFADEPRSHRRRARAVALFASGMLVGALATAVPWQIGSPEAAARPEGGASITHVAGWDASSGAAPEPETAAAEDRTNEHETGARPERAAPRRRGTARDKSPGGGERAADDVAPERKRRTASEIARNALRFTVFVRGGNVYGAGVMLDGAGHILTCNHVIEGLDRISVTFAGGEMYEAKVLDTDPVLDIALLKIAPGRDSQLVPASITSVELGDDVFAIGAPRKMAFSLSRGMVSYLGRPFNGVYYLQTDLAMNAGSSGGPVMNDRGEVVALSSFVFRNSEGLAFALPIDYAYRRFRRWLDKKTALEDASVRAFEGWLAELARTRDFAEAKLGD